MTRRSSGRTWTTLRGETPFQVHALPVVVRLAPDANRSAVACPLCHGTHAFVFEPGEVVSQPFLCPVESRKLVAVVRDGSSSARK